MKREYGAQSCAEQFLFLDIHQPKDARNQEFKVSPVV